MSVSVVMLAYKEADNLEILIPKIQTVFKEMSCPYEIIVVDSEKPFDNTAEVCEEFGAKYYPQEAPNYAGAFRTGVKYATMDTFLMLDADGSHDPSYIPTMYQMYQTGAYDVVIGSRYTKGGKSNDSKLSLLMSTMLNIVMRVCIGIWAKDISISFRFYNTENLKNVTLVRNNYDVLQEVLLRLKIENQKIGESFHIGETPITFHKRMNGESKRNYFKFITGYLSSVLLFLKINLFTPRKSSVHSGESA